MQFVATKSQLPPVALKAPNIRRSADKTGSTLETLSFRPKQIIPMYMPNSARL